MSLDLSLELPELPPCPYHMDKPPDSIASCTVCWDRFYIQFNWEPKLSQINSAVKHYHDRVNRANQYIALRADGFETNGVPPKDTLVVFALPNGDQIAGRNIDDLMGGTYPVKDNAEETPISEYLGWKNVG